MPTKKSAKRAAPAGPKRRPASKKAQSSAVKTKPTAASVDAFIEKVANPVRRNDARKALALFRKVTGEEPKMWGPSIIGFGEYHYKYESGREGDMCMTGFSPRSTATVFYVMGGVPATDDLFKRLGKFTSGKSCVYVKNLADIDLGVMEKIIAKSVAYMKKTYKAE
ncbi:MAG: DUF1801 domain-containing protein [Parvularculaceae bacterium]|nr:DUF1801 domain-containing protein [Parvularculaceae bacterium]